jgi:hypothetical protein
VDSRAGLDAVVSRRIPSSFGEYNPGLLARNLVTILPKLTRLTSWQLYFIIFTLHAILEQEGLHEQDVQHGLIKNVFWIPSEPEEITWKT